MLVNEVLKWKDRTLRVIMLYSGRVALYPFDDKSTKPEIYKIEELETLIAAGEISRIADIYADNQVKSLDALGDSRSAQKALSNYELIKPLVNNPDFIFDNSVRLKLIRQQSNGEDAVKKQIRRLLRMYWTRGQTSAALIPDYKRNKGPRTAVRRVGRKSSIAEATLIVNDKVRRLFDTYINKFILKPEGLSVSNAFTRMLADFLDHRSLYTDIEDAVPTLAQFRYHYYHNYTAKQRAVRRHDAKTYAKDIRPLTGSTLDIVQGPGSLYEVDSTLSDIYLIDSQGNFIGRPTLYSVTDVYSGMIAAVDVSLEAPQYASVCRVLYKAFMEKGTVYAPYGVDLKEEDWPVYGLPRRISADNAETLTDKFLHFCTQYKVSLINTASYRGDQKGTVERSIGLLQDFLREDIKAKPSKVTLKKAGAVDTRPKAGLTIEQFTAMLVEAALAINMRVKKHVPSYYPSTEPPTPLALWNYGQTHGLKELRAIPDPKLLKLIMMGKHAVSISRDGVRATDLKISYYCRELNELGYLERKAPKRLSTENMFLVIDPADVSCACLFPDVIREPTVYWECELAVESRHLAGKTQTEAVKYIKESKEARARAEHEHHMAEAAAHQNISKITAQAAEQQKQNGPLTKENIKQSERNRVQERIVQERKFGQNDINNRDKLNESLYNVGPQQDKAAPVNYSYPESLDDIPD